MLQGIFAAARVHGIAVCKEWLSAQLFNQIYYSAGVIGAQIADVTQFSEMQLDSDKFAVHVNGADSGFAQQLLQLGGKSVSESSSAEISKIHFRSFHYVPPHIIGALY